MSDAPPGTGTLYLIPVTLGGGDAAAVLPSSTLERARELTCFIVENARSARRFLKAIAHPQPLRQLDLRILDEHTRDVEPLLAVLLSGTDCGLMSEAGAPAIADPGAALVRRAHDAGVRVVPLAGPSCIVLALMASGMNGQRFAFRGYLPVAEPERLREIKTLEARASAETQIFIETPYRADTLLRSLLEHCRADTRLCLAVDLTLATESIVTRTISSWKIKPPALDRRLVVYLLERS